MSSVNLEYSSSGELVLQPPSKNTTYIQQEHYDEISDDEYYEESLNKNKKIGQITDAFKIINFDGRIISLEDLKYYLDVAQALVEKDEGLEDHIICLNTNIYKEPYNKGVVAGSAALHVYLKNMRPELAKSWKPNDVDIFSLNEDCTNRSVTLDANDVTLDNVNVSFRRVEDLLLNFDLAICRVAFSDGKFWISLQALLCIHKTLTYNVPIYFNDLKKYKKIVAIKHKTHKYKALVTTYYYKVKSRLEKYESRGFKPNFINTTTPVSYVKSQFLNPDSYFHQYINYL